MTGDLVSQRFKQAATEAANRAEATALLIRCGYRVYRPEADIEGEDLVLRPPGSPLIGVQLKSRVLVDWNRYGGLDLWMLFPVGSFTPDAARPWFLVQHDPLFLWIKARHGHTEKWAGFWHTKAPSKALLDFLNEHRVQPPAEPSSIPVIEDIEP